MNPRASIYSARKGGVLHQRRSRSSFCPLGQSSPTPARAFFMQGVALPFITTPRKWSYTPARAACRTSTLRTSEFVFRISAFCHLDRRRGSDIISHPTPGSRPGLLSTAHYRGLSPSIYSARKGGVLHQRRSNALLFMRRPRVGVSKRSPQPPNYSNCPL